MAFTRTTKRGIDLALAAIGAIGITAWFIVKQADRDIKFILLVLFGSFGTLYLFISQITKFIYEASLKKDIDVPVDSVKIVTKADGTSETVSTTSGTNIAAFALKLRNDLYDTPFSGHNADVWYQATLLSDTDLSSVYNYWNKEYFSEYSESLVGAINDDYFDAMGFISNSAYHYKDIVLAKLAKLGAR